MFNPVPSASRKPLARAIALASLIVFTGAIAPIASHAQQSEGSASQSANGQAQSVNIPAGPLSQVLSQFAGAVGVALSFDASQFNNIRSPGLQGSYSIEQGFAVLLAETGATAVRQGNGDYVLESSGAMTLPPVRVGGNSIEESAYGPVDGYVAKQSATGTKSDTPLIETPQSISVVTREQVEIQGADSLDKAFGYTAGIYSLSGSGQRLTGTNFTVRGFSLENQKPLFLNGSRFPIQSLSGPEETYFFERIEFLKGPASILYGQASPGGIINLVSKRPTSEQTAEVELQVGSWNRRQINADIGGPVAEGSEWGYRVTGLVRDSETMIEQIPDDRRAFSGALSWTPSEKTSLNIQATYQNNKTIFVAGLPADGTVLSNPNGKIARDFFQGEPGVDNFDISRQILSYQFEHQFNDTWSFRQNVLRCDTETEYKLLGVFRDANSSERREFNRFAQARLEKEDGVSIDNQVQANWKSGIFEHTALLGIDYSDGDFSQMASNGSASPIDVFTPTYGSPVTFPTPDHVGMSDKQAGVYFQDHIKIDQRWVMLIGGRWDKNEIEGNNEAKAEDFTGRMGLVYLFDSGIAPYFSYSESFQPQSGIDASGKVFDPTTGEQIEAGLKYEPSSYNAIFTFSTYKITQQNVLTTDLNNPGFSVQQGEVESTGAEFEARTDFNDKLGLIFTYAYNDNKVTKDNDETNIGRKQVSQPRNMAAIWLDYNLLQEVLPGLTISGGARYVNGMLNSGNTVEVPSFSVVDMALQYEGKENWKFQLNINNLFDKEYVSACGYNCFYGDERNLMFSAAYTW